MGELARLYPRASPRRDEAPFGIKRADPLIFAKLGDVINPVFVLDGVADVSQLAGSRTRGAANRPQELQPGRIDSEAMIVRVADEQVAVAVDTQSTGPAVAVVRRLDARPDKFP